MRLPLRGALKNIKSPTMMGHASQRTFEHAGVDPGWIEVFEKDQVLTNRDRHPLTSFHWGTYRVEARDDEVVALHPFEEDPDPSPMALILTSTETGSPIPPIKTSTETVSKTKTIPISTVTASKTVLIKTQTVTAPPMLKMTPRVGLSNHPERPKASCNNPKGPAKAGSFFGAISRGGQAGSRLA